MLASRVEKFLQLSRLKLTDDNAVWIPVASLAALATGLSDVCGGEQVAEQVAKRVVRQLLRQPRPSTLRRDDDCSIEVVAHTLEHFTRSAMAPCKIHTGCMCPVNWKDANLRAGSRPLTMNVSGPVCLPWSQYGRAEGLAHMATEPWLIWSKDMEEQRFDMTVLENSPRFPVPIFREPMEKHSTVLAVVHGPEVLGWPVRRPRLFAAALARVSLVWLGPLEVMDTILCSWCRFASRSAMHLMECLSLFHTWAGSLV